MVQVNKPKKSTAPKTQKQIEEEVARTAFQLAEKANAPGDDWNTKRAFKAVFGSVSGNEKILEAELKGGNTALATNSMSDAELGIAIGMAVAIPLGVRGSTLAGRASARSARAGTLRGTGGGTRGGYTRVFTEIEDGFAEDGADGRAGTTGDLLNPVESGTATGVPIDPLIPRPSIPYFIKKRIARYRDGQTNTKRNAGAYEKISADEIYDDLELQGVDLTGLDTPAGRAFLETTAEEYNSLTDIQKAELENEKIKAELDKESRTYTSTETDPVRQARLQELRNLLKDNEELQGEIRETDRGAETVKATADFETANNLKSMTPTDYIQAYYKEFKKVPNEMEMDAYIKDYNNFRIDMRDTSPEIKNAIKNQNGIINDASSTIRAGIKEGTVKEGTLEVSPSEFSLWKDWNEGPKDVSWGEAFTKANDEVIAKLEPRSKLLKDRTQSEEGARMMKEAQNAEPIKGSDLEEGLKNLETERVQKLRQLDNDYKKSFEEYVRLNDLPEERAIQAKGKEFYEKMKKDMIFEINDESAKANIELRTEIDIQTRAKATSKEEIDRDNSLRQNERNFPSWETYKKQLNQNLGHRLRVSRGEEAYLAEKEGNIDRINREFEGAKRIQENSEKPMTYDEIEKALDDGEQADFIGSNEKFTTETGETFGEETEAQKNRRLEDEKAEKIRKEARTKILNDQAEKDAETLEANEEEPLLAEAETVEEAVEKAVEEVEEVEEAVEEVEEVEEVEGAVEEEANEGEGGGVRPNLQGAKEFLFGSLYAGLFGEVGAVEEPGEPGEPGIDEEGTTMTTVASQAEEKSNFNIKNTLDTRNLDELIVRCLRFSKLVYEPDLIGSDDLYIIYDDVFSQVLFAQIGSTLFVSFKGTDTTMEMLTNISTDYKRFSDYPIFKDIMNLDRISDLEIHYGFLDAISKSYERVRNEINMYYKLQDVVFTGHSQGAVLASLMYYIYERDIQKRDLKLKVSHTITFGSPRFVRDYQFYTNRYNTQCPNNIRIFNKDDIVPFTPFRRSITSIPYVSKFLQGKRESYQKDDTKGFKHIGIPLCLDDVDTFNDINNLIYYYLENTTDIVSYMVNRDKMSNEQTEFFLNFFSSKEWRESLLMSTVLCVPYVTEHPEINPFVLSNFLFDNLKKVLTYAQKCELVDKMNIGELLFRTGDRGKVPQDLEDLYITQMAVLGYAGAKQGVIAHSLASYEENLDNLIVQEIVQQRNILSINTESLYERDFDENGFEMDNDEVGQKAQNKQQETISEAEQAIQQDHKLFMLKKHAEFKVPDPIGIFEGDFNNYEFIEF